ncbi:MAG TPA: MerR family transcriptional regulator [Bacteroidales bacterium]|jgi:DNA-binding transcriptional MerR regulator|nr:MerR family transcriptional regulator [Bacteroidales bacterium]HNZ42345.1 MerR family transcriptional regulator [Bacteroidales bacterium]HOH83146.1 MerR family transcriptional regulator [Bacteroidales bacterium]HPB24815.1 MerR family transcriptional regulator [Bacteroidales bacterium]HPI29733.1 MerR family transcriptional regulator [Bacteroidales bacterium]
MLINELSKKTGVSIHTLRYYENLGLIQGVSDEKVTTNNYKNYDEIQVERVEIIKEAKEVGFTLSEIKKMLDSWYSGLLTPREQVKMFEAKVNDIEIKIRHLKQVKKRLEKMIREVEKGVNCQPK